MSQLSTIIEQAFEDRANFTAADCPAEIRQAVEAIFKVKVISVNTIRVFGKTKRMGKSEGKRSDYKKAIVKLATGNTIPVFEGM